MKIQAYSFIQNQRRGNNIPSVITIKLTLHTLSLMLKCLSRETTFSHKYLEVVSVHSCTKFYFKLSSLHSMRKKIFPREYTLLCFELLQFFQVCFFFCSGNVQLSFQCMIIFAMLHSSDQELIFDLHQALDKFLGWFFFLNSLGFSQKASLAIFRWYHLLSLGHLNY